MEGIKFHSPINNPYVDPPVRQLVVVNEAANAIHSPEDCPTKDCYGWDLMLNGDSYDTNSDQDLDMPEDPHGKISGNTRRMMSQQFSHPTQVSLGEDFMCLEDTLSDVLQQLGETVASDPAEEVQALQAHKDLAQHDPILRAQTIEARHKAHVAMELLCQPTPSQTFVDHCLEGAQGGTERDPTMEVDGTNFRQLDALISDHPAVTGFLWGQGRTMNYREALNTVKQAKAFCQEHFNSLDLQPVYHPQEHHCATATWGGRAKGTHVHIIKAPPKLYRAQSQMHAQQAKDVLLNQMEVINASLAIAALQCTDTQMGASREGADTTGVENKTWSSDVLLVVLLNLPYDGTPSTMVMLRTPFGASGYWQRTSTEATTDYVLAQPSNIREVANAGVMATGVVWPLATMTGSVGDSQLVAPTGSRGGHHHC